MLQEKDTLSDVLRAFVERALELRRTAGVSIVRFFLFLMEGEETTREDWSQDFASWESFLASCSLVEISRYRKFCAQYELLKPDERNFLEVLGIEWMDVRMSLPLEIRPRLDSAALVLATEIGAQPSRRVMREYADKLRQPPSALPSEARSNARESLREENTRLKQENARLERELIASNKKVARLESQLAQKRKGSGQKRVRKT